MKVFRNAGVALLCVALLVTPLSSCAGPSTLPEGDRFDQFTHTLFVETASASVLDLHYLLKDPSAYEIESAEPSLGRYGSDDTMQKLKKDLKKLKKFRYDQLSESQQLTYDILISSLEMQKRLDGLDDYQEPTPTTGIQTSLPVLLAEYQFYRISDVDDYLALLADVGGFFDSILMFQQMRARRGLFMADFTADTIIAGLDSFSAATDDNYMIEVFDTKIEALPGLTTAQRADYREKNRRAILDVVLPAYQTLADGLYALRESGKNDAGLCHFKRGKEYYEALVAINTGSARTVEEMDKWLDTRRDICYAGLLALHSQYPQILDEMNALLQEDVAMTDPSEIVIDLENKIAKDFPPVGDVSYQIKTVHPSMQESMAPAFYITPPLDAPTDNFIYINPYQISHGKNLYLYTTLAHEGYPGHLYENNDYNLTNHAPVCNTLFFPGYTEGWGTYAEMQSYAYAPMHPVAAELQRICAELTLILYAKADIGIHHSGWLRDDLRIALYQQGTDHSDYAMHLDEASRKVLRDMVSALGFDNYSQFTDSLYELILGDPANTLRYTVGYLEFCELRERAELTLGDAFEPQAFHAALLRSGPAPFSVVSQQVDRYLSSVSAAPPLLNAA